MNLLCKGGLLVSGANVMLSVAVGLLLVWLGFSAVHLRGN
jgi:fluoride ion exporter CrcB/FEX